MQFLSTPSARRATRQRGPCRHHRSISIHALREEGDAYEPDRQRPRADFYPRPPRGGRQHGPTTDISPVKYFYPRPPRGGRRTPACIWLSCSYFYPRPPRGGRPGQHSGAKCDHDISIHALREEGDSNTSYQRAMADIFLSTPSARRATSARLHRGLLLYISIHALREEGDVSSSMVQM